MKTTVTDQDFNQAFHDHGRQDQFTRAGLRALFEYLEQYEEDTGGEWDLDVIALCCDFSEHDLEDLEREYGYLLDGDEMPGTIAAWASFLQDHTQVIPVNDEYLIVRGF